MFDDLPVEIVLAILQQATNDFLAEDRMSVVHIAQTSKEVYDLVAPQLFHTLVVLSPPENTRATEPTDTNGINEAARRVCGFVRCLVVGTMSHKLEPSLLPNVTRIHAPLRLIKDLINPTALRYAQLWWTSSFLQGTQELPKPVQQSLTHICGFLPDVSSSSLYTDYADDPAAWVTDLIKCLPALTHLALDVLRIIDPGDYSDDEGLTEFDVAHFETALRAALAWDDQRLEFVSFRIAGDYVKRWPEFEELVRRIASDRLLVWCDRRPMNSWDQENACVAQDAKALRTIWNEARVL